MIRISRTVLRDILEALSESSNALKAEKKHRVKNGALFVSSALKLMRRRLDYRKRLGGQGQQCRVNVESGGGGSDEVCGLVAWACLNLYGQPFLVSYSPVISSVYQHGLVVAASSWA